MPPSKYLSRNLKSFWIGLDLHNEVLQVSFFSLILTVTAKQWLLSIVNLLRQEWYHGPASADMANERLLSIGDKKPVFLVRERLVDFYSGITLDSSGTAGVYTLSYKVPEKSGDIVQHVRLSPDAMGGQDIVTYINKKKWYDRLWALLIDKDGTGCSS